MKKSLKDDMRRVLKSTVDYYSQDPTFRRCYVEGEGCGYSPHRLGIEHESKGCAIGRMVNNKEEQLKMDQSFSNFSPIISSLYSSFKAYNFNGELPILSSILSKYPLRFLNHLQELHDNNQHWDFENGGLSYQGKRKVRKINKIINKF